MIKDLVVVGGGVVEKRAGVIYAKSALVKYLQDLRQFFDSVTWMTGISQAESYTTAIDTTKVGFRELVSNPRIWADWRGPKGVPELVQRANRETAVFLNLPNPLLAPVIPLLAHRAGVIGLYVGSDWVGQAAVRRRHGEFIRAGIDMIAMKFALRQADFVFVRGAHVRAHALRYNSCVIDSAPILSWSDGSPREAARHGDPLRVMYVGKLERAKGVMVLLRAAAEVLGRHGDAVRFRFVGAGPEGAELQALAGGLGISSQVDFVGYVDDSDRLRELYLEADMVVVPSILPEGRPRVVDEALFHGLPVIASRFGGLEPGGPEVALVAPNSVPELVATLSEWVASPARRQTMASAAQSAGRAMMLQPRAAEQHARALLQGCVPPDLDRMASMPHRALAPGDLPKRPETDLMAEGPGAASLKEPGGLSPAIVILTNMIAPYRVPLFNALAGMSELRIIFLRERERAQNWIVPEDELRFPYDVLYRRQSSWRFRAWARLVQILWRNRGGVLIIGGWIYLENWLAFAMARAFGMKIVIWAGQTTNSSRRNGVLARTLRQGFLRSADAVLAYSGTAANIFRSWGIAPEKIVPGFNVGDVGFFAKSVTMRPKRNLARSPVFLFIGQLVARKGVRELLAAFRSLPAGSCQLRLLGSGPLEVELREMVRAHGISDVEFAGFCTREEVREAMAQSDILIAPSFSDTGAIVNSEGLAAGLYLIGSVHDGIAVELVSGSNGRLIDPLDTESVAQAMAGAVAAYAAGKIDAERISEDFLSRQPLAAYTQAMKESAVVACRARGG